MQLIVKIFFMWLVLLGSYAEGSVYDENQVKAAFLYNFPKFIELPGSDTLTLCIIGNDQMGDAMGSLDGQITAGKRLIVKRVNSMNEISACQILFVPSSQQSNLDSIINYTRQKQILTVGDTPGFSKKGVMVNFYTEDNRVKIEINMDATEQSKLKISSKLLKLARIIRND